MSRAMTGWRALRREDGVSAILVSLVVVFVIIPVAAVSIDLSNLYANRRQMQNAADSASLAGAQEMQKLKNEYAAGSLLSCSVTYSPPDSCLSAVVKHEAGLNSTDTAATPYFCYAGVVNYPSGQLNPEEPCSTWQPSDASYDAVKVQVSHQTATFFAKALFGGGTFSDNAVAVAAAAIQKVVPPGDLGDSPFAICATATSPLLPPLVLGPDSNGNYRLNDAPAPLGPVGDYFTIWSNGNLDNQGGNTCGLGNQSFKGLVCGLWDATAQNNCSWPIGPIPPSKWLKMGQGAQVGPTTNVIAGYPTCDPSGLISGTNTTAFQRCALIVPICLDLANSPPPPGNDALYCVAYGEFVVAPGQNQSPSCIQTPGQSTKLICGQFEGQPEISNGQPVSGTPGPNDAVRIALVQ